MDEKVFDLWHGGQRWVGGPEIRPSRKHRYEAGPGIYLTTLFARARAFAKGGKVTSRVTVCKDLRLLEGKTVGFREAAQFLEDCGVRRRPAILADLRLCQQRDEQATQQKQDRVLLSTVVNLCVNHDAITGKPGPKVAQWLVEHGVDADWYSPNRIERWLIVYNPAVIKRQTVVPADRVSLFDYDLVPQLA